MKTHSIFKAILLRATVIAGMALAIFDAGPAAADKTLEAQIESMQNELIRIKSQTQSIAAEPKSNTGCIATAKGGIQVACDNGFAAKAGGRLMIDTAFYGSDNASGATKLGDGTEMRRARLFLAGTLFNENWAYKTEIDVAENAVASKDIWLQYKGLKAFNNLSIKVGNQKEPFGLENMTSSRFITFMERADHNGLFWQGENRRCLRRPAQRRPGFRRRRTMDRHRPRAFRTPRRKDAQRPLRFFRPLSQPQQRHQ
jgi:phosphate-selective porin OprO/OprP